MLLTWHLLLSGSNYFQNLGGGNLFASPSPIKDKNIWYLRGKVAYEQSICKSKVHNCHSVYGITADHFFRRKCYGKPGKQLVRHWRKCSGFRRGRYFALFAGRGDTAGEVFFSCLNNWRFYEAKDQFRKSMITYIYHKGDQN